MYTQYADNKGYPPNTVHMANEYYKEYNVCSLVQMVLKYTLPAVHQYTQDDLVKCVHLAYLVHRASARGLKWSFCKVAGRYSYRLRVIAGRKQM